MRFLLLAVLCLFSSTAHATTYNINIFGGFIPGGVTFGPTGIANSNACSATTCAGGPNTAYSFSAQPGDILDFGTLTLSSFIFSDGRQTQNVQYIGADGLVHSGTGAPTEAFSPSLVTSDHYTSFLQLTPGFLGLCNTADPACLPRLESLIGQQQFDLTFTLSDSGFIELGWTRPFTYTPPTYLGAIPETSTWIMMLLGFTMLGVLMVKRDKRQPLRRIGRDIDIRI